MTNSAAPGGVSSSCRGGGVHSGWNRDYAGCFLPAAGGRGADAESSAFLSSGDAAQKNSKNQRDDDALHLILQSQLQEETAV